MKSNAIENSSFLFLLKYAALDPNSWVSWWVKTFQIEVISGQLNSFTRYRRHFNQLSTFMAFNRDINNPFLPRKQLFSCWNIYFELQLGYWGEHEMIYLLSQRPAITWSPMVVKAAYISSSTGLIWSSGRRKPYRPWSLSSGAYEQGISAVS